MKEKYLSFLAPGILALAGLFLLLHPGESLAAAVRVLGIVLLAYGAYFLLSTLTGPKGRQMNQLILGGVACVLGILMLAIPKVIVGILPLLAGLLVAASGVNNLLQSRKRGDSAGSLMAVITILLGLLVAINPFGAAKSAARVLGIVMIYVGVSNLLQVIKSQRL